MFIITSVTTELGLSRGTAPHAVHIAPGVRLVLVPGCGAPSDGVGRAQTQGSQVRAP